MTDLPPADLTVRPPICPWSDPARYIARAENADGRTADFHLTGAIAPGEVIYWSPDGGMVLDSWIVTSVRNIKQEESPQ